MMSSPSPEQKAEAERILGVLMPNGHYVRSPMRYAECRQARQLAKEVFGIDEVKTCSCGSCFRKTIKRLQQIAYGYVKYAT